MSVEFNKNGIVKADSFSSGLNDFTIRDFDANYQQLEYLQSTGTQYINTNTQPTLNAQFRLKLAINSFTDPAWGSIFGMYPWNDNAENPYLLQITTSGFLSFVCFDTNIGTQQNILSKQLTLNTPIDVVISVKNRFAAIDSTTDILQHVHERSMSGANFMLFTCEEYDTRSHERVVNPVKIKLYSYDYYENDVLLQKLVPAKRKSDSVYGLYNVVDGTFFTNAGTGTFVAGPVVNTQSQILCSDIIEN